MLSEEERKELLQVLKQWANQAPRLEVFGFLDSNSYLTREEILREALNGTSNGAAVLSFLEFGVRREGLARVITRMLGKPEPRPSNQLRVG